MFLAVNGAMRADEEGEQNTTSSNGIAFLGALTYEWLHELADQELTLSRARAWLQRPVIGASSTLNNMND